MWPKLERMLFNSLSQPTLCGDDSGDGGGGGGGDKTFTQVEFNAAIAKERKAWEAKSGDVLAAAKTEFETKTTELQEAFDKFKQEHEDATLNAEEKAKKAAERAQNAMSDKLKALESEKAVAVKIATDATATLRDERVIRILGGALHESNVHGGAFTDAVTAFNNAAEVELDDAGKLVNVVLGEASYSKPNEAAASFLKDRPYFEKGAGGGAGTNNQTAGGGSDKPYMEQTDSELFNASKRP